MHLADLLFNVFFCLFLYCRLNKMAIVKITFYTLTLTKNYIINCNLTYSQDKTCHI